MDINYNMLGMRLKQARMDKKITHANLAETLDVSVAYVSRIERGSTEISLKRLSQICSLLDVTEGEMLTGISSTSSDYLSSDFNNLLKNCPPEKIDLIYKIAKTIVES